MLRLIKKNTTRLKILMLFILSILFGALIISQAFGRIEIKSDATMDGETYYNGETFFNNLHDQGENGRQAYLYLHLIDYCFIFSFYSFLSVLTFLFIDKTHISSKIQSVALIPIFAGLFDLLENFCIDISIFAYPRKINILADISGYLTFTKMMLVNSTLIIIVILLAYWIYHIYHKKTLNRKNDLLSSN